MIAACHYVADAEEAADGGKTMPDVPPAIARDLELEAKLITPAEMEPGEPIGLALALVNRSKTKTYSVVQPGDGSEVGWNRMSSSPLSAAPATSGSTCHATITGAAGCSIPIGTMT
jgi:hypothetical protein